MAVSVPLSVSQKVAEKAEISWTMFGEKSQQKLMKNCLVKFIVCAQIRLKIATSSGIKEKF
jgi:hypothetical protein